KSPTVTSRRTTRSPIETWRPRRLAFSSAVGWMRGSESLKRRSGSFMPAPYARPQGAASGRHESLRLAVLPGHLLAEQRHRRDRHLRRAVLHLPRMGEIDERVVGLVVDAVHHLLLPDQADALLEDLFPTCTEFDVANGDRSRLLAGNGGVGRVLEPVALLQTVDDAPVEIGDMTGDTFDLGVLDRL